MLETEIKLRLPAAAYDAIRRHPTLSHADPEDARHEVTTYYDTPTLDLARQGVSLRIRTIDGHRVQTVKAADHHSVAAQRNEWEQPVETDSPDLDALAGTPAAQALHTTDAADLQPAFTTEIYRVTRRLRVDGETLIETAFDQGVIAAGANTEPVSEFELELKHGNPAAVYRLAIALLSATPMAIESSSKAERGMRLRSGEHPQAVKAAELNFAPDVPTAEAFVLIIRSILSHIMANLAAARAGDVEGVHQLRIAIRRMRAALVLFRPLLQRETAAGLGAELRRAGQVLGHARDWDVFLPGTLTAAAKHAAQPDWLDLLRTQAELRRAAAHSDLRQELDGPAFTGLLLGIAGWIEDGAADSAVLGDERLRHPVAEIGPELIGRLARKVASRGRHHDDASDKALHELRKSIKKLRYGFEFFAPLFPGKRVRAAVDACKDLQDLLGHINDAAVTPDLARTLTKGRTELAPAVGALAAWAEKRSQKARRRVPKAWRKLRETEAFQH